MMSAVNKQLNIIGLTDNTLESTNGSIAIIDETLSSNEDEEQDDESVSDDAVQAIYSDNDDDDDNVVKKAVSKKKKKAVVQSDTEDEDEKLVNKYANNTRAIEPIQNTPVVFNDTYEIDESKRQSGDSSNSQKVAEDEVICINDSVTDDRLSKSKFNSFRDNTRLVDDDDDDDDEDEEDDDEEEEEDEDYEEDSKAVKSPDISILSIEEELPMINSSKIPDTRQIASWSPNYERIKEKLKQKHQQPAPKRIQVIDLPNVTTKPNILQPSNKMAPFGMNDKQYVKLESNTAGAVATQPPQFNNYAGNSNFGSENELKVLSIKMLNILESKPNVDEHEKRTPKKLKLTLLDHQFYAINWLRWREATEPRGGILADDMGLGKTLTVLSYLQLIIEDRETKIKEERERGDDEDDEDEDRNDDDDEYDRRRHKGRDKGGKRRRLKTLVIVPASLLHHWTNEIDNHFEKNAFKYYVYHDANRKKNSYNLHDNDIVFTTYEIVTRELDFADDMCTSNHSNSSPLAKIKWKRIILDEAHRIKNHNTKASKNISLIKSKYRLAITGTPIHNSLNDLFSLVRFLQFEPLNNIKLWKYLFESSKPTTNPSKLNEVRETRMNSWLMLLSNMLILRRTKQDKVKISTDENGIDEFKHLVNLPDKHIKIVELKLRKNENCIYKTIFNESKDKVNKFINNQQRRFITGAKQSAGATKFSDILVYLLRLRQACSHMNLLSECIDPNELENAADVDVSEQDESSIQNAMTNLTINSVEAEDSGSGCGADTSQLIDNILKQDDDNGDMKDCLKRSHESTKLQKLMEIVKQITDANDDDKLIIISQWTSLLSIIAYHLDDLGLKYCEINGSVSLMKRNEIVQTFNNKRVKEPRVMLLSLQAGGVGLNLIGANHLFLFDIHWNPALEQQAIDRIFRIGQTKNVYIYKFLILNTIEQRIFEIQKFKIDLARKVCHDGSDVSAMSKTAGNAKLTIRDIKLLFQDFE